MKLDQDDRIIGVKICRDDQDILLSTQFGKCIRFKSKKLRLAAFRINSTPIRTATPFLLVTTPNSPNEKSIELITR